MSFKLVKFVAFISVVLLPTVLGKITCKMIIVKDQDHKGKTDLKSRSKIT